MVTFMSLYDVSYIVDIVSTAKTLDANIKRLNPIREYLIYLIS
jgi:hypothetical protein